MDGGDKVVDVQQALQSTLDGTHVASRVDQELPQIQNGWIGKDLDEGVEMEVVASHGHEKIHLIDTLRNVPFKQGSESMVNNGKEENMTRQDINDKILQQTKAGVLCFIFFPILTCYRRIQSSISYVLVVSSFSNGFGY